MTSFNPISIFMDARRVTRGTPEMIAARQQERLAEKYHGLPDVITDVRQLPPVTKIELMEHFDEVITDPGIRKADMSRHIADLGNIGKPFMGKYMVWTTSGTTGTPGIFLEDKNWVIRGMMKAGGNSASVLAGNGHFLGVTILERQRNSNRSRRKHIRLIPVTMPIQEIVKQLNDLQPAMFAGYASALGLLAHEQIEGRLNIHPSIVISSAEPLSQEDRSLIQKAFDVPPRNNYGCSEGGVMGYECRLGYMHINADWIIFELVDAEHNPISAGQLSDRLLITNLANRVMPIIRYEMGDRASLSSEPCACGITLPVVNVEGRTDEILRFKTRDGGSIPILPLALWSVLKETPGVLKFQAIQIKPDELKIRLESKYPEEFNDVWKRVYINSREYLTQQGLQNVGIVQAAEPPLRDPKSGKFRNIWAERSFLF